MSFPFHTALILEERSIDNDQSDNRDWRVKILERLNIAFTAKGKREFVPRDQVSLFSSFIVHDFNKIVSCFTSVLSIKIVFTCFYLLISYFEKLST